MADLFEAELKMIGIRHHGGSGAFFLDGKLAGVSPLGNHEFVGKCEGATENAEGCAMEKVVVIVAFFLV